MSFFSQDKNQPRTEPRDEVFTTAALNFYPSVDRGLVIIRLTIDNQDVSNSLTYSKNGPGGTSHTLPPNSIAVIDNEILSGVTITPDGTTGTGEVSADLAVRSNLEKDGFIGLA